MSRVVIRGESVYECDVCKRHVRVPTNRQGMDVMPSCNITSGCKGSLRRVTSIRDINNTPATPPEVEGVQDWYQRDVFYTHQQPIQSTTWVVEHNLQNIPNVHVFVYREIDGDKVLVPYTSFTFETVDANTTIVRFPTAESGQVQCVSLVSKNTINYIDTPSTQVINDVPISSTHGEVTIATLNSDTLVDLRLTFSTASNLAVDYSGIDAAPSLQSAWAGASNVIINGRIYTVRSFNITSGAATQLFATGQIPSGTSFIVNQINSSAVLPNQVLFLLSVPPHTYADRVYDRYIDSTQVNALAPEMYYANGVVLSQSSVVRPTYPLILAV